jgi:hypothetical protein
MNLLLFIIAALNLSFSHIVCLEALVSHPKDLAVRDCQGLAKASAHSRRVPTSRIRTRQAGQPGGSHSGGWRFNIDVEPSESDEPP